MPMRIGYDAKRLFLNHSGLGNYSRTLVGAMTAAYPDEQVLLYTPRTSSNQRTQAFHSEGYDIRTPGKIPSFMRSWWRSIHLGNVLKQDGLDIYHGLSNELPKTIANANCKSVLTIHDLIFLRFPEYYPRFDRATYRSKVGQSLGNADAVVAISERTKADLVEFFQISENRIKVIYQGCDLSFYETFSKEAKSRVRKEFNLDRPFIISVGTIEKRKNQLELVKAYFESGVSESHDLVLVGKARKYSNEITNYLKTQSSADRVRHLPAVSFQDLPPLLQSATLSVYSSLYEGFGLPVLESLASKIPVIARAGSCLEETGGTAAKYYSKSEELGPLMKSVLENTDLQQEMVLAGIEHAKKFDNEQMARNYHSLYESLIS